MSRAIAEGWLEAFKARDIAKLKLAADFVHSSPYGEIEGGKTYLDMVRANEEAFFDHEIVVQDLIGEGDRFAVRYLMDGNPSCDCIYVKDGKIVKIFSYYHVGKKPSF